MKSTSLVIATAAVAALVAAAAVSGAVSKIPRGTRVHAKLSAKEEVPPLDSKRATGSFHAIIFKQRRKLRLSWTLSYRRLSSRSATEARIHLGRRGANGKMIVQLCKPCGSAAGGLRTINASIARQIRTGRTYVNVYTKRHPNGEVRGQVTLGK